jgi:predicted TIM-barrel fold metal-dependent hydrolase
VTIITHLHIIDLKALRYPWLDDFEPLRRDFLYETYAREARRCGIGDVLHMEMDVELGAIEAENAYIGKLSRQGGALPRGAISARRPESEDFAAFLECQLANPFIRGLRCILHTLPDDPSEGALFPTNVAPLSKTDLLFDPCVLPHQIDKAIARAGRAIRARSLRRARNQGPRRTSVARANRRIVEAPQCRGQDFRCRCLCRRRELVRRRSPAFRRAFDRELGMGPRGLGQRLAGLHRQCFALDVGGRDARLARLLAGCSADEAGSLVHQNARRIWRLNL